ncbi:hypothetical protein [Bradyrhizobium elkanii]|nr:hypothetical protein [Bradyrhizobium elkanii]WLA95398.1 hypothetical protein QNJ96_19920 [Bradyrhizobium elkanii]
MVDAPLPSCSPRGKPRIINEDVLDVFAAKNQADREAVETILDIKV